MIFMWRSSAIAPVTDFTSIPRSTESYFRIFISAVLGVGIVYGVLISITFRKYGEEMDQAWKKRVDGFIMRAVTLPQYLHPRPVPVPHAAADLVKSKRPSRLRTPRKRTIRGPLPSDNVRPGWSPVNPPLQSGRTWSPTATLPMPWPPTQPTPSPTSDDFSVEIFVEPPSGPGSSVSSFYSSQISLPPLHEVNTTIPQDGFLVQYERAPRLRNSQQLPPPDNVLPGWPPVNPPVPSPPTQPVPLSTSNDTSVEIFVEPTSRPGSTVPNLLSRISLPPPHEVERIPTPPQGNTLEILSTSGTRLDVGQWGKSPTPLQTVDKVDDEVRVEHMTTLIEGPRPRGDEGPSSRIIRAGGERKFWVVNQENSNTDVQRGTPFTSRSNDTPVVFEDLADDQVLNETLLAALDVVDGSLATQPDEQEQGDEEKQT